MKEQIIKDFFQPLINEHAWNVKKGYGSFLTFEFGTPTLQIGKPRIWKSLLFPMNMYPTRQPVIRGKYHLWIYCCNWKIQVNGKHLAFEESSDHEIGNAAEFLNGQKLTSLSIDTLKAQTKFQFDLDGELLTFNESYEPGTEMWMLYMPEKILTFNNLGQFSLTNMESDVTEKKFETAETEIITMNPTQQHL